MRITTTPPTDWDALLTDLVPHPPFLQTTAWAEVKARQGWQARYLLWQIRGAPAAATLLLTRTLAPGLRVGYLPHGPVADPARTELWTTLLADIETLARRERLLYVKADPPVPLAFGEPGRDEMPYPPGQTLTELLVRRGWQPSLEWVQFPNTLWLDITPDEDTLLAQMKQKTRYNIRLAFRKGVQVRVLPPEGFPMLYAMYAETARRDGFIIREEGYYLHLWHTLHRRGMLTALVALVEDEPVAGLVLVHFGPTAWYVYGMSRMTHRDKMPNHALQWEAIRHAKTLGCTRYDFWGAPFRFSPEDPMWGVYRFKKGFGAQVVRTLGPWDWASHLWVYRLYHHVRPRVLTLWRRLARIGR